MSKKPKYNFEKFKNACKSNPENVIPFKGAMDGADFFNLRTKTKLLEFIANDGLESFSFINSKPLLIANLGKKTLIRLIQFL